jgi:WhiB family transcriptional regulator, redox-sensing transcriptional regulator
MALVERWMDLAVCRAFPELPWLTDRGKATAAEVAGMRGACRACGVVELCRDFVEREGICGGFWAGEFRDSASDALGGAA